MRARTLRAGHPLVFCGEGFWGGARISVSIITGVLMIFLSSLIVKASILWYAAASAVRSGSVCQRDDRRDRTARLRSRSAQWEKGKSMTRNDRADLVKIQEALGGAWFHTRQAVKLLEKASTHLTELLQKPTEVDDPEGSFAILHLAKIRAILEEAGPNVGGGVVRRSFPEALELIRKAGPSMDDPAPEKGGDH